MSQIDKFIVDTNVLISSLLIRNLTAFKALEYAGQKGWVIFSEETFLEFESVLLRKKFDKFFSKDERLQIIEKMHAQGVLVPVTSNISLSRDPKDDKFLSLAIDAGASCIITGDQDWLILHPFEQIPVLSPSDFLNTF